MTVYTKYAANETLIKINADKGYFVIQSIAIVYYASKINKCRQQNRIYTYTEEYVLTRSKLIRIVVS